MSIQSEFNEIIKGIYAAFDQKLNLIGSVITGEAKQMILDRDIKDRGDFFRNAGYVVEQNNNDFLLRIGSNVEHEPFVLGGKVPSWTPIEPLIGWVERKNLNWTDKQTGKPFTVKQMAYMIQRKIRRDGIAERNIFAEIVKNKEKWIFEQLNMIDLRV